MYIIPALAGSASKIAAAAAVMGVVYTMFEIITTKAETDES